MKIPLTIFTVNCFPICCFARKKKGTFKIKIKTSKVIGVKKLIKREIPVTPPLINPFEIKKLFIPKATKIIPAKV